MYHLFVPAAAAGLTAVAALGVTAERVDFQPTEITESVRSYELADESTKYDNAVDELNGRVDRARLTDVLRDANHSAKAPCGVPPTADSVQFCWSDEDNDGKTWIPQGLTGSWDANADSLWNGHRVIAATWYDARGRDGTNRGSRITFVNYDDAGKPEYRHVLLVVPDEDGKSFHAAKSHVGGIAWYGYRLYVADTDAIRVFDLHNVWRTRADNTHKKIGILDKKAYAADYRYAIPQVGHYRAKDGLRISAISLDRSTTPDSLVTVEYKEDRDGVHSPKPANARIVRWNLGRDGKPDTTSSAAYVTSRANVNGALTIGDGPAFVLTSSEFNRLPAWIHRAKLGSSSRYTSVRVGGPEDLTYQPRSKRVWTLTEYDGRRTVVGIPLASIGER